MVREHRLSAIEFGNKAALLETFPDFDLYKFSKVRKLRAEWINSGNGSELVVFLTGEYCAGEEVHGITFRFDGVRELRIPDLYGHGLWLSELELEDISGHQLEGVRYQLIDYGSEAFSLSCWNVEFVPASNSTAPPA